MKYTISVEINLPLQHVIQLFDNPTNYPEWMEGLQRYEVMHGEANQQGSQAKYKFLMGTRSIEMLETIAVRNFPEEFTQIYEAKNVYNVVKNHFYELNEDRTKYITEHEFRFSGMMKWIAKLMPGAFKTESIKSMHAFKKFAEETSAKR